MVKICPEIINFLVFFSPEKKYITQKNNLPELLKKLPQKKQNLQSHRVPPYRMHVRFSTRMSFLLKLNFGPVTVSELTLVRNLT